VTSLRGRWLERPWGRMRVWEAGRGEPILLVHGLGGSGRYFERLAARLDGRFLVVAPDLAGFGSSDKPKLGYDRAAHLEDLDAVARGFGDRAPVVAGHSLGGLFAALWAARRPGTVRALAIVAAPYPSPDEHVVWTHEPEVPAAARVTVPLAAAAVRLLAVPIGVARRYPPAVAFDYARQTVRSRNRTMRSVLYDPTVAADLEGVRALDGRFPILLEHARDDRTVGLDAHERWRALLPNAEHRAVAGGHQVQLHEGFRALAGWVDGVTR
jgi:pimeloyl-ACP methyl ester carboxylesterase